MDTRAEIAAYIAQKAKTQNFDFDTFIFEEGLVSSLFFFELITFIENNYSIKIELQDLTLETFSTVDAIDKFIQMNMCRIKKGE